MKYGFLFSGYEARAYFWEIMIMYRKILVIASSVFLSTVSPESQVLVVIFIIVLNMFFQIHVNPFSTPTLNKMENYSLQVAAVTIYTGMFYVTGKNYSYMKIDGVSWFFLVCIVLPNLIFLVYWGLSMRIEVIKTVYKLLQEQKLKVWMFKTVAWTSPEVFYEKYIREDEEFAEKNKQIIIDADDEDTDKEPVKLEDVALEIADKKHQQDDTNVAFYDDMDKSGNYTHDDLMKEP